MKRSLFALALAAALPLSAQARDLSYDFVELDYSRTSIDEDAIGVELDPTGWGLKGSKLLGEKFYFYGGYQAGDDDIFGYNVDTDTTNVGFGWRHAIGENADFNAELGYVHQNLEIGENIPLPCGCGYIPNFSTSADGFRASAGVRGMLGENFEGWAKANYTDGSDFEGDFSGTLGGQFMFAKMWGVTAEAEFGEDYNTWTLGVRASF
jgi:opacity protein-like surface antigen